MLVASGLQSFLDVVVEVAHREGGCTMGIWVFLGPPHLGGKGLEVRMKQCHSSLPGISSIINQPAFQLQGFPLLLPPIYGQNGGDSGIVCSV